MWDVAICSGIVTYYVTLSDANGTVITSVAIRNFLQFTFTDLMSNTSYAVTVLGANEFGNGTAEMTIVTTGALPQDNEGTNLYIHVVSPILKLCVIYNYVLVHT